MSEPKFTPGPWAWFGNTKHSYYLATNHSGRRYVMGFRRKGMGGAEPCFQVDSRMVPATDLAIFEVNPEAASADDPSIYRNDIIGFRSPDASLIAAAPELYESLSRLLLEFDFMVERNVISDVRDDIIFVSARKAIARADGRKAVPA